MQETLPIHTLADNLFRHESGKLVAILSKIFGMENLETAEDVVQQTFIDALQHWKLKGVPANPSAWLFRVAKNKAIDILRRNKHSLPYDFQDTERVLLRSEYTMAATMQNLFSENMVQDDMLRMMFACCHSGISAENQITLILKTLCGFSTKEIAKAFLTTEETITKRLYRTKEFFRKEKIRLEIPTIDALKTRLDPVLNAIYLLFTEGFHSAQDKALIRQDLVEEAMFLCRLLTASSHTRQPEVFALMALMCFHAARSDSRLTPEGEIILLAQQDRSKWNQSLITEGNNYMNLSAFGDAISSYHLEAAIAFEHCSAVSFDTTNWTVILRLYETLCMIAPSPVTELNKAVAIMKVQGPAKALEALEGMEQREKLERFYLYPSLLGEIHDRLGHPELAKKYYEAAIILSPSEREKKLLHNKIMAIIIN